MAHFAELDSNNTVLRVLVVRNKDMEDSNGIEQEEVGISFLQNLFGGTWKQTSYNTRANVHYGDDEKPDGKPPFKGNFAGIGAIYDPVNDVFIAPQPYPSWTISAETNWVWKSPTPKPEITFNQKCNWDEATKSWVVANRT